MPPTDDAILTPLDKLLSDWEEEDWYWAQCRYCRTRTGAFWHQLGDFPHAEDCPVRALATVRAELAALRARLATVEAERDGLRAELATAERCWQWRTGQCGTTKGDE